ncbi:MAG: lytic transglycosylase F, partial [Muribaculaceae bacterium]|nr:lytic transglycosylase F [Muribaculaceae bacterium]
DWVKTLSSLDNMLKSKVPDADERAKFILASYNAGPGHVSDAIALASKYGLDASKWDGNVETAINMKSKPAYYHDPVVKNGYFRAKETINFVRKVQLAYDLFRANT